MLKDESKNKSIKKKLPSQLGLTCQTRNSSHKTVITSHKKKSKKNMKLNFQPT
jgi:hypothetical protein